jgi:hypothetical protein
LRYVICQEKSDMLLGRLQLLQEQQLTR